MGLVMDQAWTKDPDFVGVFEGYSVPPKQKVTGSNPVGRTTLFFIHPH